jgi:hypothetical protein
VASCQLPGETETAISCLTMYIYGVNLICGDWRWQAGRWQVGSMHVTRHNINTHTYSTFSRYMHIHTKSIHAYIHTYIFVHINMEPARLRSGVWGRRRSEVTVSRCWMRKPASPQARKPASSQALPALHMEQSTPTLGHGGRGDARIALTMQGFCKGY